MDFLEVRLQAAAEILGPIDDFYGRGLGLEEGTVGTTRIAFVAGPGRPFYHFALLVPGNRFDAALDWLGSRAELLPDASGDVVFDFANWGAKACYFHDPAGNIVELIAHEGVGETGARGSFSAGELLGLSELGLVGEVPTIVRFLEGMGLELWDGTVEEEGRLAFVGEQARTFVIGPVGRPWLPTRRAAEAHPLEVVLAGPQAGEVIQNGYRVRGVS